MFMGEKGFLDLTVLPSMVRKEDKGDLCELLFMGAWEAGDLYDMAEDGEILGDVYMSTGELASSSKLKSRPCNCCSALLLR